MRIVEVIGSVTLSRAHPSLVGARWLIGVPFSLEGLRRNSPDGEDLVLYDQLGASPGTRVGMSEGVEASAPFLPDKKPLDAYCACLLDQVVISE
jgi:ethanolamine utilization protein EutN